jgi:hypothetical protein
MRNALIALLSVLSLALVGCPDGGGDSSGDAATPAPYVGPPRGAYSITYAPIAGQPRPVSLSLDTNAWTLVVDNGDTTGIPGQRKNVVYTIPNRDTGPLGTLCVPAPLAVGAMTGGFIVNVPVNGFGSITCTAAPASDLSGIITLSPLTGHG